MDRQLGLDKQPTAIGRAHDVRGSPRARLIALVVVLLFGLGALALERNDAINPDTSSGGAGFDVPVGSVFAVYHGFHTVVETATLQNATLLRLDDSLEVVDVRLFVMPGTEDGTELPHGCMVVSAPFSRDGPFGRERFPVRIDEGKTVSVVFYLRAVRPGRFSTESRIRIDYRQGLLLQSQVLPNSGVQVVGEVTKDARALPDDLQCSV